ncbi:RNA polymerase sigma-70 factor (ECF subfamily) [Inquilinus ginsengisoli]|uniref:RNA polymerase sigma-70 factor (ECF subfamily) n=1 Tax=Inquilinus ginsengisoli TaxID=363840 RepID=A0ABU1JJ21_9PROT|nr:sigma-70 family RNA polymerase sigma factor [Inquilinus ginsengisoli]MDR6288598.1 RNA polymerase sigma-70 factor (ECF subfamily) [Inquilinus ginsengisoli]
MPDGSSEAFGRLMAELRPRLHRYCARMVGSAIDGEDVVQEALAKAAEAFPAAGPIERPDSWLFRIAHNAALDALRRRRRRAEIGSDVALAGLAEAGAGADAQVAATASLATLLHLPVAQRSSLVLIDVLGHSLVETADILGLSVPAVKAALHRARVRLKGLADAPEAPAPVLAVADRARLRAYADRFNARDFEALRDLLAEDVRLELVNRTRLAGREVSTYFGRYAAVSDWHLSPGLAEGRPALLVGDPADPAGAVRYVILLGWADGRIATIRDFRHAAYATEGMVLSRL